MDFLTSKEKLQRTICAERLHGASVAVNSEQKPSEKQSNV